MGNKKILQKMQKFIRRRMNISRVLAIRIIQSLEKIEMIAKKFESMSLIWLTVCERSIWMNGSFRRRTFYFLRPNLSVVEFLIGFLISGLGCGNFCWGGVFLSRKGLPRFVFMYWMVDGWGCLRDIRSIG